MLFTTSIIEKLRNNDRIHLGVKDPEIDWHHNKTSVMVMVMDADRCAC